MCLPLQKAEECQPERLSLKAAAISRTKPKANRTLTATAWRMLGAATGRTAEIEEGAAVVPAAVVTVVAAVAVEGPVVVGGIVDAVGLAGEDTKLWPRGFSGKVSLSGRSRNHLRRFAARLKPCHSRSESESTLEFPFKNQPRGLAPPDRQGTAFRIGGNGDRV
jgi:hypothetical protein